MKKNRRYSELIQIPDFEGRIGYLRCNASVGFETFGSYRYLNQRFYASTEWQNFRNHIVTRDGGCDLGLKGYEIGGRVIIHHLEPLTLEDFLEATDALMNPENVICVTPETHRMIHFQADTLRPFAAERTPNDTCPWRR